MRLKQTPKRRLTRRGVPLAVALAAVMLALPALALAHLERPSYWPDPRPDNSVSPPAGGKVPKARSLQSAASGKGPGDVLVVCKGNRGARSLALLRASVREARKEGYRLRPSQRKIRLSKRKAQRLLAINDALAAQCDYRSVQKAVLDAGNNDRILIMPGRYTEPNSRRARENDPKCNPSLLQRDASGDLTRATSTRSPAPTTRT